MALSDTTELTNSALNSSTDQSSKDSELILGFLDRDNYDTAMFLDDLSLVKETWTEDVAFYPTAIVYGLAFVVGVVGNILVVFAILGDKKSRNVTMSFLVSLAFADLLFLLVCIPNEVAAKFMGHWSGGLALCKVSGFVEMLSASASVVNLTAVTVERYIVIVHPMKSRTWCTLGNTCKIIIGVWFIAIALSAPVLHIMDTSDDLYFNNETYIITSTCGDRNFRHNSEQVIFAWYQLIVLFLAPMIIMMVCYAVVIQVLWLSTKELAKMTSYVQHRDPDEECKQQLTSSGSSQPLGRPKSLISKAVKNHSAEIREARKQVIKMLLTIIVVFLLAWGPKLILNITKKHEVPGLHYPPAFYAMLVINLLPYVQSAVNPIIYGFMSNNFRRSLRTACRFHCCCDPARCLYLRPGRLVEYEESKSINGTTNTVVNSRFSPSSTRMSRTCETMVDTEI